MIMMGTGHSATTMAATAAVASTGALTSSLAGTSPVIIVVAVIYILAGALRPDIDHPEATATHHLSFASVLSCHLWRALARQYYAATRTADEDPDRDPHRTLTHTPVPGAILLGGFSALSVSGAMGSALGWLALGIAPPSWALDPAMVSRAGQVLAVASVGSAAALAAAPWGWRSRWLWGLGGLAVAFIAGPALAGAWPIVWAASAFGCVCHDVGDSCTNEGSPLAHPFVRVHRSVKRSSRKGQTEAALVVSYGRWIELGPPRWLRFPTNSYRERFFVWLCLGVAGYCVWRGITTASIPLGPAHL